MPFSPPQGKGHGHSHYPVECYTSNRDMEDGLTEKLQNGEAGLSLPRVDAELKGIGEDDKILSTRQTLQVRCQSPVCRWHRGTVPVCWEGRQERLMRVA